MPLAGGGRLHRRFSVVPRDFKIFDSRLCGGKIAFVHQGGGVHHDGPEGRKITDFRSWCARCCGGQRRTQRGRTADQGECDERGRQDAQEMLHT
jgi:hypothetical protein